MKCVVGFCVIALTIAGAALGQTSDGSRVRVQLIDGSQLFGVTPSESIQLKLEFSELTIPLSKVRRVEWKPKSTTARVELMNEDVISGQLLSATIPVDALFGRVELRCEHLKSLDRLASESAGSMPIRKGLVAYYSFDHGLDSLGADDAHEKFVADVKGAKWVQEGRLGGAAEFDGFSSLTAPHDDALNFSKGLTLSTWVRQSEAGRSGYAMLIGKTSGSSWSGGYGLARMSGDAEHLYFFVNHYTGPVVKAPVKAGEWTHVVGVCDGDAVKIFINGKEVQSTPLTTSASQKDESMSGPITPVTMPLMLGSDQSGYFWSGMLDETALFDRALTNEEISRLYDVGASSLVAK